MKRIILLLLAALAILPAAARNTADLEKRLAGIAAGKDARIGVAVVTDAGEIAGINIRQMFPMFSVFKFPLAIAVADKCAAAGIPLADSIAVAAGEMHTDTYSPMLAEYPADKPHKIPIAELLRLSLTQSDNNAADILLKFVGGPAAVTDLMRSRNIAGITILASEADMHADKLRAYSNIASPAAMARLFSSFRIDCSNPLYAEIRKLAEACTTGSQRIPKHLGKAVVAHKTGSGDIDKESGKIDAINDAGYVLLPDGSSFAIAVFIADAHMKPEEAELLIADFAKAAAEWFTN